MIMGTSFQSDIYRRLQHLGIFPLSLLLYLILRFFVHNIVSEVLMKKKCIHV